MEDDKVDNHNCTDIPSSTCEEKTRSKSPFEPIDKLTEQKSDLINQVFLLIKRFSLNF